MARTAWDRQSSFSGLARQRRRKRSRYVAKRTVYLVRDGVTVSVKERNLQRGIGGTEPRARASERSAPVERYRLSDEERAARAVHAAEEFNRLQANRKRLREAGLLGFGD